MIIIAIILVLIIFALALINILYTAKPKHLHEWTDVYWFCGNKYGKTGLSVPRAFWPLFSLFSKKKFGLTFAGVRVFIKNEHNELLIGLMEANRRINNIKYDIGVGGGLITSHGIYEMIAEELYEEVGISNIPNNIQFLKTTTPSMGYFIVIHHFIISIKSDTNLISNDKTFEKFYWKSINDIKNNKSEYRQDPFNFIMSET